MTFSVRLWRLDIGPTHDPIPGELVSLHFYLLFQNVKGKKKFTILPCPCGFWYQLHSGVKDCTAVSLVLLSLAEEHVWILEFSINLHFSHLKLLFD